MITGNVIDEIKCLPEKEIHRFAITNTEEKLSRNEITKDNALDIYSQVVLDYLKEKKNILNTLNQDGRIVIIDAIMGTGKSTYIINEVINKNPQNHYMCVLKTLDECKRYAKEIEAVTFEPKKYGTKSVGLQKLIATGQNIVTTHALVQNIDDFTIDLLKKSNYVLIIDECLDVVHQYESNFKSSDLKTILEKGYVEIDYNGFLVWNNRLYRDYDGRFNDIKQLCNLNALMCTKKQDGTWSNSILMWNFPVVFFSLFQKCYICTYLWNGSMQKSYFDLHKIQYSHLTLKDGKVALYNPSIEQELRRNYFSLINLHNGRLNEIGISDKKEKNPLTVSWYQRKARTEQGKRFLEVLKNNTYNYFRNYTKSASAENMYTTFKPYIKYIKGIGYSKGFVSCSTKATNEYRNKSCLAYLINLYPQTNLIRFFESHGIEVNQDLYALSELLQWIWRSQIRDRKPINLYMPSERMRRILGEWALGKI